MVAASDSPYDLPIYPRLHRASKHDSDLFLSTFHTLKYWYPDWKFGEVILDSALYPYPIYEMDINLDDVPFFENGFENSDLSSGNQLSSP
ncbi:hypothetical protein IQ10_01315 [Halalkalibacter nanhaiisediminis]|uniref:Uncharacterized protein n=1 Tax=Halalkalibacter nanhaiisediminis TaxID=688079 RepID=A0A562QML7_9BACI|nr:hypothetical protein IQ10_01315 [Halalkalibacter nanhaiisediminis]